MAMWNVLCAHQVARILNLRAVLCACRSHTTRRLVLRSYAIVQLAQGAAGVSALLVCQRCQQAVIAHPCVPTDSRASPHLILTQMVRTWSLLLRVARRLGFLIPARPESSPLSQHTFILHCVDQGARLLEEGWLDQGWLNLKTTALPSGSSPTWALPAAPCG